MAKSKRQPIPVPWMVLLPDARTIRYPTRSGALSHAERESLAVFEKYPGPEFRVMVFFFDANGNPQPYGEAVNGRMRFVDDGEKWRRD